MSKDLNLIKDLRETTGAGFVDCKNALSESNNDVDKAIDYLRKKGLSKANKKSSREAKDGIVSINIYNESKEATIIEINSETDFAAKNIEFINFVKKTNDLIKEFKSFNDFSDLNNTATSNLKDNLNNIISKIGENIVIRRFSKITAQNNEKIYGYVHNKYDNNIGKIACLLKVKANKYDDKTNELLRQICMHISALKPISLSIDSLDKNIIDKEKEILMEGIKSSGKPENIINNILKGKINKFYEEVVLLEQKFIIDNETKIKNILNEYSKNNNNLIQIIDYKLFVLGN
ncbi:MAG: Elongation factor Ts [Alphaproteobacteria bacterium MarineAlpha5_Bin11]|nr:translation elongation factor Ts [Pelagibacteraceae bacterium]PPR42662.1 MAG: Elongation factor Ts [Alphaproteobacteria bacterium MarineAlpha5_Bin11]|tara:strand:+ start:6677 stop:7546 length:870 start_codon:yes stop_codon:yes gene_type:complete